MGYISLRKVDFQDVNDKLGVCSHTYPFKHTRHMLTYQTRTKSTLKIILIKENSP